MYRNSLGKKGQLATTISWFSAMIVIFFILILFMGFASVLRSQKVFFGDDELKEGSSLFSQESARDFMFIMKQEVNFEDEKVPILIAISKYLEKEPSEISSREELVSLLEDKLHLIKANFTFVSPFSVIYTQNGKIISEDVANLQGEYYVRLGKALGLFMNGKEVTWRSKR